MVKYEIVRCFVTPVQQTVLSHICHFPEIEFTGLALGKELDMPISTLSVTLNGLEILGVIKSKKEGKFRRYKIDKKKSKLLKNVFKALMELKNEIN